MKIDEFEKSFLPIAQLGFSPDKLSGALDLYFNVLNKIDDKVFYEVCQRIASTVDILHHFPSPMSVWQLCAEEEFARRKAPDNSRAWNTPEAVAAMEQFYRTLYDTFYAKGEQQRDGVVNLAAAMGFAGNAEMKKINAFIKREEEKEKAENASRQKEISRQRDSDQF